MDVRISKTQKALADATIWLMAKYVWRDISVSMLCEEADISRSTFYAHFPTKAELLEQMYRWTEEELVSDAPPDRDLDRNARFGFLPGLIKMLRQRKQIFQRQQHNDSGFAIAQRTREMVANMMRAEVQNSALSGKLTERNLIFLSGAVSAVIRKWADDKHVESDADLLASLDEHVARFLTQLGS